MAERSVEASIGNPLKTLKISELIAALEELKEEVGDLPIVMSIDQEGSGYGTFSIGDSFCMENGIATLWSWNERVHLDEIEGYIPDSYDDEDSKEAKMEDDSRYEL